MFHELQFRRKSFNFTDLRNIRQFLEIKVDKASYLHQGAMSPHARESKTVMTGF